MPNFDLAQDILDIISNRSVPVIQIYYLDQVKLPEASPATAAVCLIAAAILLAAAIRQGEWKRFVLRLYPR